MDGEQWARLVLGSFGTFFGLILLGEFLLRRRVVA